MTAVEEIIWILQFGDAFKTARKWLLLFCVVVVNGPYLQQHQKVKMVAIVGGLLYRKLFKWK